MRGSRCYVGMVPARLLDRIPATTKDIQVEAQIEGAHIDVIGTFSAPGVMLISQAL